MASREVVDHLYSVLYGLNLRMGLSNTDAQRSARDAIRMFTQHYGGSRIYIPISLESVAERDEQIRRLRAKDMSIRQLAKRFSISKSQVHRVLGVPVLLARGTKTADSSATNDPTGADHA